MSVLREDTGQTTCSVTFSWFQEVTAISTNNLAKTTVKPQIVIFTLKTYKQVSLSGVTFSSLLQVSV